ncbi:MAG: hypothetical protein HQL52_11940, partial [Magnetococcales bacterium]|nr:hypothetical protein [Magnetococcales bacterium]
ARALDLDLARALDRALDRDRDRDLDRARARDLAHKKSIKGGNEDKFSLFQTIQEDESLYHPILETVCELLNLTPKIQWLEALRVGVLPQIPERITLVDPEEWERIVIAFSQGNPTPSDHWEAACQLFLDVWYRLVREDEEGPPLFEKLSQLTRDSDHPGLQIAHCIRDVAYGQEQRVEDLKGMIHSQDPKFREIFVAAYWVDP